MQNFEDPDPSKQTITGDGFNNWFDKLAGSIQRKPVLVVILALFVMFGGLYAYEQTLTNRDLALEDTESVLARGSKFNKRDDRKAEASVIASSAVINDQTSTTSQSIEAFTIEAEDYDEGGQGEAYYDRTRGNYGNSYRDDDVDIGGSAVVGWIDGGEWLSYTFTTDAAGSYDISAMVARQLWQDDFPANFRFEVDGVDVSGTVSIGDTGGWNTWKTIDAGTIFLEAGEHKLVFRVLKNNDKTNLMNLNWIRFAPSDEDDGGSTTPIDDPGDDTLPDNGDAELITIQSEDYESGGEGIAYHDDDPENRGGAYRNDGVDIESRRLNEAGYSVGWINGGEWLKYSFNAAGSSEYDVKIRVARDLWQGNVSTGFTLELDGKDISGLVNVAGTGGWDQWVTLQGPTLNISQGQHELVFRVQDNGRQGVFNVDWIKFVPEGQELVDDPPVITPPPVVDPPPTTPPPTTPLPTPPPSTSGGYDLSIVGPLASITCPSGSVTINSGNSISSAASNNPEGTTFCIKSGTYYGQTVYPKTNQTFIGEVGAVMDGQNSTSYAFFGSNSSNLNVTIKNLEIKNYSPPIYRGAITMHVSGPDWWGDPYWGGGGWQVVNCNIHHNIGTGVTLHRDNARVENTKLNNNGQVGINFRFGSNQKAINNEIGYNDPAVIGETWGNEGGASKFWETKNLVLDSNWVHDNQGPGLWADHGNDNTTYSNNTVENNISAGIFHEISYSATIFGNTVKNNGFSWSGWYWGAGIQIVNSGPATIYDNYLEENKNGIMSTHQDIRGNWGTESATAYGNTLVNTGASGTSSVGVQAQGPFNFYDNTYTGSSYTVGL